MLQKRIEWFVVNPTQMSNANERLISFYSLHCLRPRSSEGYQSNMFFAVHQATLE